MIYGIGCDIVDIIRFEKYINNKTRLKKLYTNNELKLKGRKNESKCSKYKFKKR